MPDFFCISEADVKDIYVIGMLLALVAVGFGFDRVVVLEESYQET